MFFCSSDLAQGFALKTLTDILASFLSKEPIKRVFKGRLLSTVLHGYLSLRRLVVQRTKLVDQTQEKMLELLEDMTSGTLEETKNFMAICVQTIDRYSLDDQVGQDLQTKMYIFSPLKPQRTLVPSFHLSSIIYHHPPFFHLHVISCDFSS